MQGYNFGYLAMITTDVGLKRNLGEEENGEREKGQSVESP
jgi:hypothetical protein